ncbi:MAG: ABATE domain-containing protein [Anaerolineae bacterium]|nr:ABATE domain-containing protein [Gemmatimonadaceae bacterium]
MAVNPGDNGVVPFKFVSGDLSLDFVNTVDWTDQGLRDERLADYDSLVHWAESSGAISADVALRLSDRAFSGHEKTAALSVARELRSILEHVFARIARARAPDEGNLQALNKFLGEALGRVHLATGSGEGSGGALQWSWIGMGSEPTCMLWPVLWSAAALLSGEEVQKLRVCAGVACGWMYLDRSRNGLRRWCEMSTCGARAKARRHYERTRGRA